MDYLAIVKKAYEISLKHKFLWIFGILAGGFTGVRMYNFSLPDMSGGSFDQAFTNFNSESVSNFFVSHAGLIFLILGLGAVLCIIFGILRLISQGALISSSARLNEDQKVDFHTGFSVGVRNFWRVLAVGLIYALSVLAVFVVWLGPAIVIVVTGMPLIGAIWGILLFFVFILTVLMIALVSPYTYRIVVLKKSSVMDSIRESLHFFRDNWGDLVLIYLLLIAASIGYGIVLGLGTLIVAAVLALIGYLIFLISAWAAAVYGLLAVLALVVALVTVSGAYGAFSSSVLTLTYQKLAQK